MSLKVCLDHQGVSTVDVIDLVAADLIDLHFVESSDKAFPRCLWGCLDDDHRTGEGGVVADFLSLCLIDAVVDLRLGREFLGAPFHFQVVDFGENLLVAVMEDFADTTLNGAFVTEELLLLDVG